MIAVNDLGFSYQNKPLLSRVNFIVAKNTKVGLVGPNGAGKSTLFKLINGELTPDNGEINVIGSLSYVPQEVRHDPTLEAAASIEDYLNPTASHYAYELERLLAGLGVRLPLSAKPRQMSGGQKTKLAIARAFLEAPHNLLLDEPTNFLDTRGKKWLMSYLAHYPGTVLLVSHDLELLDKQIKKILLINIFSKRIEEYKGNYSSYLKLKDEREAQIARDIGTQTKQIERLEKGLKRMKFTSAKGVRRRVIQQRRIADAKAKLPQLPPIARRIKVALPEPAWVGQRVVVCSGVSKSYNEPVLVNINFELMRGQKLALVGPNGAGKSTLIKIIMGLLEPDKGTVSLNQSAKIGYYSQEFETFDLNQSLLDSVSTPVVSEQTVRSLLGKFLFPGERVYQRVISLSGGEKTRLSLAKLLLTDYNLLVLDEPTTYLDLISQRAILEALQAYHGAMIIVSHTEEFLRELKPDKALLLPENRLTHWSNELLPQVSTI